MAWIESHQALRAHPKTKRLARTLGIDRYAAIGLLQCLWWWVLDYADDGDLTPFDDQDIADGLDWPGDPGELITAFTGCGFIDADRQIHDWAEYGGKLVAARSAERERSRARRLSIIPSAVDQQTTSGRPAVDHNTTDKQPLADNSRGDNSTGEEITGEKAAIAATKTVDAARADGSSNGDSTTSVEPPWKFSLAGLSPPAAAFVQTYRTAYGAKRPPTLNRTQVAQLEEAVVDLGPERLEDAAIWAASQSVEYGGGGVIKAIRAARTKRQTDEHQEFYQERVPAERAHGPPRAVPRSYTAGQFGRYIKS